MASTSDDQHLDGIEIRNLHLRNELAAASEVLQQVWGSATPLVAVELLRAIEHSGGYVAGAYDHDRMVGASFGWLARHADQPALHSHVTGILPGLRHAGVGRAIKHHQRSWAAERGLEWITWTFDPLVRVNAWFNIGVLGAEVAAYLENFYGEMTDSLNANDESDRLVAAWRVSGGCPPSEGGRRTEVPTPPDIVSLRRTDPAEAQRWRVDVRSALKSALTEGGRIADFTREGAYIIEYPT
jgi:predicted GNAT superfamily acetyltransferase